MYQFHESHYSPFGKTCKGNWYKKSRRRISFSINKAVHWRSDIACLYFDDHCPGPGSITASCFQPSYTEGDSISLYECYILDQHRWVDPHNRVYLGKLSCAVPVIV